ncbi:alpha/beta fold hydrolase [Couchioplanes caeruleus]|uniref:Alpha/beta hydrolase n=2 Tax=Couchioplanes caeruleus TaxID=56438 RepID=A0A1K0FE56_9ACTN|nr:alpha/beta hydrolase [Couchioplanes caeruleus]OJF11119.1 alpha/beta hydrolase [Couchioplanes caeruleus subsp. caeruleus]ROP33757.1 pimeloyl-ACP methyl ester carboxylesterase [Couchioplanes caeruleus]
MSEGFARHGDVRIAYEVEGPTGGEPLLLIMGLGLQMLFWPEDFRALLTKHGFRVARFDNRDVGLSSHLDSLRPPSPADLLLRRKSGYALADMAGDALAVMDALGWESAHVAGVSLGGMIAQTVATNHPGRVRSLTSISSTPSPRVGRPRPSAMAALLRRPATGREAAARHIVEIFRVIGSPAYPRDEKWLRETARRSYDRAHDPAGVRRQLAAVVSAKDRRPALRRLRLPALVLHGAADPLIRLPGGVATARAIAGAKLVTHPGMGHDLPNALQGNIAAEIAALARGSSSGEPHPD